MLSGPQQGAFLNFISRLKKPHRILEVGTFTGYAAICLARGLADGGVLHTIEVNPELEHISRKFFQKAGLEQQIHLHLGDAKNIIPSLHEQFDIAFIDAGKQDYAFFYEMILEKLPKGGIILADNTLWSGKVLDLEKNNDADTLAIDAFNAMVHQDDRVQNILLPIRDGLMIAEKL